MKVKVLFEPLIVNVALTDKDDLIQCVHTHWGIKGLDIKIAGVERIET